MVVLKYLVRTNRTLHDDLLQNHFIQTRKGSLPLAGEVNIYVIQNAPFPPDEDVPRLVEETALIIEDFVGVPFPTTDITLYVVDYENTPTDDAGIHWGNGMWVSRHEDLPHELWGLRTPGLPHEYSGTVQLQTLYHETAHYYFNFGPHWFHEGMAEFMLDYVQGRGLPAKSLGSMARDGCRHYDEPIENIWHYNYILDHVYDYDGNFYNLPWEIEQCGYSIGEAFLLAVFGTIGEEAMSAAVGELYRDSWQPTTEEVIYRAFLKHAPEDRKDVFRYVYRRLHGGEYAFDAAESQAANDVAARVFEHISWFEDPPDDDHYRAAHSILAMWIRSRGFWERISRTAWLEDGVNSNESWALSNISAIADTDIALATMVADYPWFTDGIAEKESGALSALWNMVNNDAALAKMVASLPWFTDGIDGSEEDALSALGVMVNNDAALAKMVASLPWFTDGIDGKEGRTMWSLIDLVRYDAESATMVANHPWFTDGLVEERRAIVSLHIIAAEDAEFATMVANLPWLTDGIAEKESDALFALGLMVNNDAALATMVASLPWFTDGIDGSEEDALSALGLMVNNDGSESPMVHRRHCLLRVGGN